MENILDSIKKLIGVSEDCTHFDESLLLDINGVMSILTQLGVGPDFGIIIDENTTWDQILFDDPELSIVKTYMFLKVKLMFDPPASSAVIESINNQIQEFTWRIEAAVSNNNDQRGC